MNATLPDLAYPSSDSRALQGTSSSQPRLQHVLARASEAIERGEAHLREAAGLLVEANDAGVNQRQIAETIGRAQSWVSRLIRWHRAGATGTPFGPESKRRRKAVQVDASTDQRKQALSPVANSDSPDSLFHLCAKEQAAAVEITRLWFATTERVRRYLNDKLLETKAAA